MVSDPKKRAWDGLVVEVDGWLLRIVLDNLLGSSKRWLSGLRSHFLAVESHL